MREELDITPGMAVPTRNQEFEFHKKEKSIVVSVYLLCVYIYIHINFIV